MPSVWSVLILGQIQEFQILYDGKTRQLISVEMNYLEV